MKKIDKYSFINFKSLLDESLVDEINKKEEIFENKNIFSKEKSAVKINKEVQKPIKNSHNKVKVDSSLVNNKKIESFFQKK